MQPFWLEGGTIADGTGADPVPGTSILVEAGRIAQVGGSKPRDTQVLDCSGLVLAPGLIDAHVRVPEHFAAPNRVALLLQEGRVVKVSTDR